MYRKIKNCMFGLVFYKQLVHMNLSNLKYPISAVGIFLLDFRGLCIQNVSFLMYRKAYVFVFFLALSCIGGTQKTEKHTNFSDFLYKQLVRMGL